MAKTKKEVIQIKHYRQTTDYSCGPACLKMIINYFGKPISEYELMDRTKAERNNGVDVDKTMIVMHKLGFRTEPIVADYRTLQIYFKEKPRPILIHFEQREHYVVLVGINQHYVYLADPSEEGMRRMRRKEFIKDWKITDDLGWFMLIEEIK